MKQNQIYELSFENLPVGEKILAEFACNGEKTLFPVFMRETV